MKNVDKARRIISGGIRYIQNKFGSEYKWSEGMKESVQQLLNGRTRYTEKDLKRLETLFNRSRLRSSFRYQQRTDKVVRVPSSLIFTPDKRNGGGEVISNQGGRPTHYTEVRVGTTMDSPTRQAQELARQINKTLKKFEDLDFESKNRMNATMGIWTRERPSIYNKAKQQLVVKNIKSSDMESLVSIMGELQENTEINQSASDRADEYAKEQLAGIITALPSGVSYQTAYMELKNMIIINIADSNDEREVKLSFYEDIKPNYSAEDALYVINNSKSASEWFENLHNMKELAQKRMGRAIT